MRSKKTAAKNNSAGEKKEHIVKINLNDDHIKVVQNKMEHFGDYLTIFATAAALIYNNFSEIMYIPFKGKLVLVKKLPFYFDVLRNFTTIVVGIYGLAIALKVISHRDINKLKKGVSFNKGFAITTYIIIFVVSAMIISILANRYFSAAFNALVFLIASLIIFFELGFEFFLMSLPMLEFNSKNKIVKFFKEMNLPLHSGGR